MPPPSQLAITTSSVQRLIKEETSYHKELTQQEARLQKLQADQSEDENREFALNQERKAIEETRAVFPPLRQRISDAVNKLQDQVEAGGGSEEEIVKAKDVIEQAKTAAAGK